MTLPFSIYYLVYATLGVLLVAYIPAIIAAEKEHSFFRWYIYGAILLPVAFIHSLFLKKPVHQVNIFIHDENHPTKQQRKSYRILPREKKKVVISSKYIYMVFFSKLIFGMFIAFSVFATFRTFVYSTETLVRACAVFAVLFSVMLSIVELCRYSEFPLVADEITKRALIMIGFSVICSLPLYLLKVYVVNNLASEKYANFIMFLFCIASFVCFVALLLRKQRVYYVFFNRISQYCILSLSAYVIYAAITLVWMSSSNLRPFAYAVVMPTQLFNFGYFDGVEVIRKSSSIYSSAFVHLCIAVLLLISGLLCRNYKKKEMEFRVEYRSKAFRMSRKRILRRHIPSVKKKQNEEIPQPVG